MFKKLLSIILTLCSFSIACKETTTNNLSIEKEISPNGGEIILKNYVKVAFEPKTFEKDTKIKVSITNTKSADKAFNESSSYWDNPTRSKYEINIIKGKVISNKPFLVEVYVPTPMQNINKKQYLALLTRGLEESKLSRIDSFGMNPKSKNDTKQKLYLKVNSFSDHILSKNDVMTQIIILKADKDPDYPIAVE